jgi:hypothetical protein
MGFDPIGALYDTLKAHEAPATRVGDRLILGEQGVAVLSAAVFNVLKDPEGVKLQLDVRVSSPRFGDTVLIESFAGLGKDEDDAVQHGFWKFMRASMLVLMASLVDAKFGEEQVEWQWWTYGGRSWRVCLGPLLVQGTQPDGLEFGGFLEKMKSAVLPRLSEDWHWIRMYFFKNGEEFVVTEALLDNEDWPEGRESIEAERWPGGVYGARIFLMLMRS